MSLLRWRMLLGVATGVAAVAPVARGQSCAFQALQGSQTAASDQFGRAVDTRGDLAAVGAIYDGARGAVYLFERSAGGPSGWNEIARIQLTVSSNFGWAVSVSGDTAAAATADSHDPDAVHIFDRNEGGPNAWGEVTSFATVAAADALSIDGDFIAIGSTFSGLHILERNQGGPNNWGLAAGTYGAHGGGDFGQDVVLRGDWLLGGAPASFDFIGRVLVFHRDMTNAWTLSGSIESPDQLDEGRFGSAVALDGDTAVVGAPAVPWHPIEGSAHVFERTGALWPLVATLAPINDAGEVMRHFGRDVAITGECVAASAVLDGKGVVYLFHENEGGPGNWGQTARVITAGSTSHYGWAIASWESRLIVGDWGADAAAADSGAAYVYEGLPETDCNTNGICDGEEFPQDCNTNGALDLCDVAHLTSLDCNANGVPDECDIEIHFSADINSDGVPDECTAYAEESCDFVRLDGFGAPVAIDGDRVLARVRGAQSVGVLGPAVPGELHTWSEVTTLDPGDAAAAFDFGDSLALEGDVAIVGDPLGGDLQPSTCCDWNEFSCDDAECQEILCAVAPSTCCTAWSDSCIELAHQYCIACDGQPGRASVFVRAAEEPETWSESAVLVASDIVPGSRFGSAVALSGDIVVVGAERARVAPNTCCEAGPNPGCSDERCEAAVCTVLPACCAAAWDETCVLLVDYLCATPCDPNRAPPAEHPGAAYVFERNLDGTWAEVGKLVASEPATDARFGDSVAIDGSTAVVASSHDSTYAGSADVFERDVPAPGAWGRVAHLTHVPPGAYDYFGTAVASSGDLIAIGAPGVGPANCSPGAVDLFGRDVGGAGAWGHLTTLVPPVSECSIGFGSAVAISGNLMLIGAAARDVTYLYRRFSSDPADWQLVAAFPPLGYAPDSSFGFAAAIDGQMSVLPVEQAGGEGSLYLLNAQACVQCPGDADGNGAVGFGDLNILLTTWGQCPPPGTCAADLNGDGQMGFADLTALLLTWGPCVPGPLD